jgi:hypothetical protein
MLDENMTWQVFKTCQVFLYGQIEIDSVLARFTEKYPAICRITQVKPQH